MATTNFQGNSVETSGSLPAVGESFGDFTLVGTDLGDVRLQDFAGKRVVVNVFPSVDTGVCAASVRRFNEEAAKLDNTVVLCVSKDLPFALDRFCGAEGIENVVSASDFRGDFGSSHGLVLEGSPLRGLLTRAVFVLDEDGVIRYEQLVDEITTEPDYDAALQALS